MLFLLPFFGLKFMATNLRRMFSDALQSCFTSLVDSLAHILINHHFITSFFQLQTSLTFSHFPNDLASDCPEAIEAI